MDNDGAPITQLLLTVQFAPPALSPNPIQLADIFAPLRAEYPIYQQVGRAGPMPIDPAVLQINMEFGAPRNSFGSADGRWTVMFQEDRFSLGWNRMSPLTEPSGYPGFSVTLARALKVWGTIRGLLPQPIIPYSPIVGEIVYTDQFDMMPGHGFDRLSSVFNILNPAFAAPMASFNLVWSQPYAHDGFLQAQIGGPAVRADGRSVTQYQTTSRFRITEGWDKLAGRFETGHGWALQSFKDLINPDFSAI